MRLLPTFASACALVAGVQAAQKSPEQRFADFHGRFQAAAGPVALDDASYKDLTSAPRDHSVAVLLTALGARFGCQLCREFQPEWDLIGSSWAKGDRAGQSRMLFGTLDFAEGRDTFLSVLSASQISRKAQLTFLFVVAGPSNRPRPPLLPSHPGTARRGLPGSRPLRLHERVSDRSTAQFHERYADRSLR